MVDANSVPQGTDPNAAPVYKLMRQLGVVNLARRISESVTDRQQPNGFRKVEDSSLKDTDADRMAKTMRPEFYSSSQYAARQRRLRMLVWLGFQCWTWEIHHASQPLGMLDGCW